MDSFDSKLARSNTHWWITSLAISITCCSVLFVFFANYIYQIREDLAIARVRSDIAQSRLNEMMIDFQMLNHRSTVQQIQIIPPPAAQAQPALPTVSAPDAAAAAAAASTVSPVAPTTPAPTATPPLQATPPTTPAPAVPAKH